MSHYVSHIYWSSRIRYGRIFEEMRFTDNINVIEILRLPGEIFTEQRAPKIAEIHHPSEPFLYVQLVIDGNTKQFFVQNSS